MLDVYVNRDVVKYGRIIPTRNTFYASLSPMPLDVKQLCWNIFTSYLQMPNMHILKIWYGFNRF